MDNPIFRIYYKPMAKKGMALVEILVSMLMLAVGALAVASTISMVNGREMRSAGGSSLDLQALSYARQTLESLKNGVSTDTSRGASLTDSSCGGDCRVNCHGAVGVPCTNGSGTPYTPSGAGLTNGLPTGSDLVKRANTRGVVNGASTRTYTVRDISDGNNGVAYKRVTVDVIWND